MATPARKKKKKQNHKFIVKVLVPQTVSARIYAMESYQKWMRKTMKKKKTRELSDLPDDLMESILERLSSADRIRFGATCKKNLSFVTTKQQHHRPQYQVRTVDKLPWMATFYSGLFFRGLVFRLFEPLQQRGQPNYADYQIRDPKGEGLGCLRHTTIKACKKGWFLCLWPKEEEEEEEGMTCFLLFCPFNKRIIKLPYLDGRCHMSENGDYWSSDVEYGMWIEPPSPTF